MVWKPHVTVAAIIERDHRFLMIEEESNGQIVINQPAGHLEQGESLIDAVKRETFEETAWNFEPTTLISIQLWQHPDNSTTFLRVSFAGGCYDFDPSSKLDSGIIRTLWLSRNELLEQQNRLRSPMVISCIDDYISGIKYPLSILKTLLT